MDRWQAMRVFVKVAESGGFADAGRHLNLSPPAVTRVIAGLEEMIGTRLLTRTTRSVKLTEAGSRYFEDCRRILSEITEAEAAAAGAHATPTGTLIVTASMLFGNMYVLPIITEFLDQYPAMTIRSLFLDRITNIVDEGIDVAVRIGHLPDSGYSAVRVGSVRRVICAAPAYFEKHGVPQKPADLAHHNIVMVTAAWNSLDWQFGKDRKNLGEKTLNQKAASQKTPREKTTVTVHPRLLCNNNEAAISAAISGWGLTRVLSYQIAPALMEGKLQITLSDFEEDPLPIHLVHATGRHASAKVRSFIDFASERLRANRMIN
jgi:DNA-binding transcriptional LysR family regulator